MTPENVHQNRSRCNCDACKAAVSSIQKSRKSQAEQLSERLENIPKVKASPDFDKKMAARFALELHDDINRINLAWLRKSGKIRLPHLISDLRGELF